MREYAIIFGIILFGSLLGVQESFALICEPIELDYTMEEGIISEACFSKNGFTIYATIENNDAGRLSIEIPDSVVFRSAWACSENYFDLLIDGKITSFNHNPMLSEKKLEFEIPKNSSKIEIAPIGPLNTIHHAFVEQCIYDNLNKISPHSQKKMGIPAYDTICKSNFELIFKSANNSPTCVKSQTAQKLVSRGWATVGEVSIVIFTDKSEYTIGEKIRIIRQNLGTTTVWIPGNDSGFLIMDEDNKTIANYYGLTDTYTQFPPKIEMHNIWNQKEWSTQHGLGEQVTPGLYTIQTQFNEIMSEMQYEVNHTFRIVGENP